MMKFKSLINMSNGKKLFKYASWLILFCLLLEAESTGEAFVFHEFVRFVIDGEETRDYDQSPISWAGIGISVLASLPYVLTMLCLIFPDKNDELENESSEEEHDHQHSLLGEVAEFCIEGLPFGLLTYGGSMPFLQLFTPSSIPWTIGNNIHTGFMSLADAFGNYKLHSHHFHSEEGVISLFKKLPPWQKAKAIGLSISVILGHVLQGTLDGIAFLRMLPSFYTWLQTLIAGGLGALVAGCEGRTEIRSAFQYMVDNLDNPELDSSTVKKPYTFSQLILILPSLFKGGLLPTMGVILAAEMIYKLITGTPLVTDLELWARCVFFAASFLLIGLPNALTFHRTVLPATDKFARKMGSLITQCKDSLFSRGDAGTDDAGTDHSYDSLSSVEVSDDESPSTAGKGDSRDDFTPDTTTPLVINNGSGTYGMHV